ncbi:helix-turn-helix transcriptional regulator [Methylocystis echinoides]|uniref:WYL domain-containing protein n=1 Tax=Methylocystis echinoides TaxID=29468 RepID=A0A9W6GZW1_9HYPH|nr:WYL domain-containing protein [Methylocystis echinoides]GLI96059.1 hypothetical protein LMG27198_50510 [Methylocystis echinoides]
MADESEQILKWNVRQRLEFIDFRLFWEGRVSRPDIAKLFGISVQQASGDVQLYQQLAPGNMDYDVALKRYTRLPSFRPVFTANSADRHLLRMVALKNGWMTKDETWFDGLPSYEVVSLPRRNTEPAILLGVLDAIRLKQEIEIAYQSMTGAPHGARNIAPHALAHSAGRWYVRAWSREHNDFRDYHLSRIGSTSVSGEAEVDFSLDYEWNHLIDLVIIPNPELTPERQKAVVVEYNMVDNALTMPIRLSLAFYLINEYNLDVPGGALDPLKQQIVLKNKDQVAQARDTSREMSRQALARAQRAT